MTLEEADKRVREIFGDAFCAICQDGTCEVFLGDAGNAYLIGTGKTLERAIWDARLKFDG